MNENEQNRLWAPLWSPEQVAAYLHVSKRTVLRSKVLRTRLPWLALSKTCLRVPSAAVKLFVIGGR